MIETGFDKALFSSIFDAQSQPVFWLQPVFENGKPVDFTYEYCNREMYRFSQKSEESLIGKRLRLNESLSEELRERFFFQILEVYNTGNPLEDRVFNDRLKKYYSFLRTRVQGGVLTVVQDRTLESRSVEELERKSVLLEDILRFSNTGISVTEVIRDEAGKIIDGRTTLANKAAAEFTGIPEDIYLTTRISEIDPEIMNSPLYQLSLQTLETGKPFHTQYYFEPGKRWLELSVSKMDDDHLINVFSDITATKEAQLKVEESANRLSSIFKAAQSGMFIFRPEYNNDGEIFDFRFVIANPSFAAYVDATPEDLEGELGSTYFPGYLNNGVFDMYRETILTGKTLRKEMHYNVDGLDLWLDLMSTKVDQTVLVTFTDHTALRQVQYKLEKTIEDLKRSNANLEEFAYAASHDLKEPIRKVHFFSDRLKARLESRLDEEDRRILSKMENAMDRMSQLVDDLLDYSHVSFTSGAFDRVNLNEKLRKIEDDLELMINEKNGRIINKGLPTIKGLRRQLQQLFQNLISNALKYAKPGQPPVVEISCKISPAPEHILTNEGARNFFAIEVKDNGIGFEQQDAERIFQVFQRLHGNAEYKGTGVGLAIAQKVAQNHGGFIIAKGEPGRGATFTVYLPEELGS